MPLRLVGSLPLQRLRRAVVAVAVPPRRTNLRSNMPRDVETLTSLLREIRELNIDKGWRNKFGSTSSAPDDGPWFAAYIALAHSELSEALDAYRDKDWSSTRADGKPIGVGPELADSLIRLLDMIDIWGIDIRHELARVLDYGWTRPYQHGGRVL
jgi:hypothetical protein